MLRGLSGFGAAIGFALCLNSDDYVTLDIRLAWRPLQALEFALVGQNLLDRRHGEFEQEIFPFLTEIERGVYGVVNWRF